MALRHAARRGAPVGPTQASLSPLGMSVTASASASGARHRRLLRLRRLIVPLSKGTTTRARKRTAPLSKDTTGASMCSWTGPTWS